MIKFLKIKSSFVTNEMLISEIIQTKHCSLKVIICELKFLSWTRWEFFFKKHATKIEIKEP